MTMSGRAALAALLACLAPAAARAASCEIPRALLCEGCASALTVTITPAGGCRIAFTPGGDAGPLRLEVRRLPTSRASTLRPSWRRVATVASRRATLWRPAAGPRCFTAGLRRYCE